MVKPGYLCVKYVLFQSAVILFFLIINTDKAESTSRVKSHQMLRVYPQTNADVLLLNKLYNSQEMKMDFITRPTFVQEPVEILVSPVWITIVRQLLHAYHIPFKIVIHNVQKAIEKHKLEAQKYEIDAPFRLDRYHPLQQINRFMTNMSEHSSGRVKQITIGTSYEGRPINLLKISASKQGIKEISKPAIWIDAGIHSNEWIGPATLLFFIDQLVKRYGIDNSITEVLNHYDVYVLPVLNVDGYVYSWTQNRLWRKNRAVINGSSCRGVDLNRNWNVHWGETGCSHTPCSSIYSGPSVFSEPEVKAVSDYLKLISPVAYIAYHSFSQLLMLPYSYSMDKRPSNYYQLLEIAKKASRAMKRVHQKNYKVGQISKLVGPASGSSVDYVHDVLRVPFTFGVELRDTGDYGVILPAREIIPTAEEALRGFLVMLKSFTRYEKSSGELIKQ